MFGQSNNRLIFIGFILVVLGVVLPLLMVIQVLESTFFLNFLAYGSSVVGLVLGVLGAAGIALERRDKENRF